MLVWRTSGGASLIGDTVAQRVLDPLERSSEILFGLIMVLTFTGTISVTEAGREETREVLIGALSCNLAWGLVDGVMYLMAAFMTRARSLTIYKAVRAAGSPEIAHRLIREALPPVVSSALAPEEIESLYRRLDHRDHPPDGVRLQRKDVAGAVGVFLLVFLSTFPVVVPFILIEHLPTALRTSNAVAIVMLFATGWSLGRFAGRPAWRTALGMVAVGLVLMAITMALGG